MRELRICMEINGLAEDENGNPCPGGMSLSLGMVPDEDFEDKYKQLVTGLDVNEVLKFICWTKPFQRQIAGFSRRRNTTGCMGRMTMAKEYIEREAAVVMADYAEDEHPYDRDPKRPETFSAYHEGWSDACDYIRSRLESLPAADVAPVRHGRWIDLREDDMDYEWKCSSCGETFGMAHEDISPYDVGLNYCPNCGAKMDLEG
jgi:DNA-directed RNA polymerase subunit RPC12/RpoP